MKEGNEEQKRKRVGVQRGLGFFFLLIWVAMAGDQGGGASPSPQTTSQIENHRTRSKRRPGDREAPRERYLSWQGQRREAKELGLTWRESGVPL